MKLLIIHHHLNPGGVTRIIQSQVSSLRNAFPEMNIAVMTDDVPDPDFFNRYNVKLIRNPNLNYLQNRDVSKIEAEKLLEKIDKLLGENLDRDTILHAHNINLGKNPVMTLALSRLANQGYRLVNHAHDFAEDRPANLSFLRRVIEDLFDENLNEVMYPGYENYHYAVLNSFDFERLLKAGIKQEAITLLPNPVHFEKKKDLSKAAARKRIVKNLDLDDSKKIISYPVRVIRRKNIGEMILLSVLFRDRANWLVTQPPKNPVEIEFYDLWKSFCEKQQIQLLFEAGTRVNFEVLLTATDICITTSTREGFGMVYLEPWLLDTPVMGRNINYVTKDLIESGVEFPLLYDELKVIFKDQEIDFGTLSQDGQMDLIAEVIKDEGMQQEILQLNPALKKLFEQVPQKTINHNKAIIRHKYSLENYANRLNGIYKKMD